MSKRHKNEKLQPFIVTFSIVLPSKGRQPLMEHSISWDFTTIYDYAQRLDVKTSSVTRI